MPIMTVDVSGEARRPQTQQLKHNYHPGRPSSGCLYNAFCFTGCIRSIMKSFVKKKLHSIINRTKYESTSNGDYDDD